MSKCFVAWYEQSRERVQSTSGGMFTAIANYCLANGGVVVAARYGEGLRIEHAIAERVYELNSMRGVKYAHSVIDKGIYVAIRKNLNKRLVAFFGLPCQCAAMRKLFGYNPNLILVDLVCFGAPPLSLWLKYIEWLEQKKSKRLISVNPRDKGHGWGRRTYYRYEWSDGTVSTKLSSLDPYAQAFYSTIGFRKCCFNCQFRGVARQTDMTIGDCWGVESMGLELRDDDIKMGISGVLVHNEHALEIFRRLNIWSREISAEMLVKENLPIVASPKMPKAWKEFAKDVECLGFGMIIQKWNLKVSRLRLIINGLKSAVKRIIEGKTKR